ncbi:MAG: acyltransferase [Aquificaceae bacterium]|nr:acyltransferase [Aquificaceae bacterium]
MRAIVTAIACIKLSLAQSITILGDSLILASMRYIRAFMPEAYIDAKVGRKFQEAIPLIDALEQSQKLGKVVVINLTTNAPVSLRELLEVSDRLSASGRQLVIVNTRVPRHWESYNNENIKTLSILRPQVLVVDWHLITHSVCHDEPCLKKDGYHLTEAGTLLYSLAIYSKVSKALER